MEPQFKELSEQLTREVTAAVTTAVNARVTGIVTATEQRLSEQALAHREKLIGVMTGQMSAAEQRLSEQALSHREELVRVVGSQVSATERRLSEQAQANVEAVKDQAKLAAEGYAATLDSITRHLHGIEVAVGISLPTTTRSSQTMASD